ncbi:alpha/beta fold hydrolase [Streptomyces sp. JHA26]|uniref:alpha/beta fold hydrolase n=1 Tax=Streptomyces sp. JHA26 TaxID=1917143 RepID=UPI000D1B25D9|nr:alpha/beta hydrolase [Streptomyces sp. JHA26]
MPTEFSSAPGVVRRHRPDGPCAVERTGRRTARTVPGAELIEYPNAGHGPFVTHRDRLNADLLEFLGR